MLCPSCGIENGDSVAVCANCLPLHHEARLLVLQQKILRSEKQEYDYAGFWLRLLAGLLDYAILFPIVIAGIGIFIKSGTIAMPAANQAFAFESTALSILGGVVLLYNCVLECSFLQGSLGKVAFGISVTTSQYERISFARALLRNILKIPSAMIFNLGYLCAAFTEKKQALHDLGASCLVVVDVAVSPLRLLFWGILAPILGFASHMGSLKLLQIILTQQ